MNISQNDNTQADKALFIIALFVFKVFLTLKKLDLTESKSCMCVCVCACVGTCVHVCLSIASHISETSEAIVIHIDKVLGGRCARGDLQGIVISHSEILFCESKLVYGCACLHVYV